MKTGVMKVGKASGALWLAGLLLFSAPALARDIAGVKVPDAVHIALPASGETTLVLNGAGIRSKFIFDIYVGALYLPHPAHSLRAILAMPGPKRVVMYMLYHAVSAQKMREAWQEGFADNLSAAQRTALAAQLSAFEALFPAMKEGDVTEIDFLPHGQVSVRVNGTLRGSAHGAGLDAAVLGVWLGKVPADADLKAGMLGTD